MMKLYVTKKYVAEFLTLATIICILTACEKEERYASVTINGVEYIEKKISVLPFYGTFPASMVIWENYHAAQYHTLLTPLTGDYPYFDVNFWILLEDNSELEINKSYKIWGMTVSGEYDLLSTVTQLKEKLPTGFDGIVYCYKEGTAESFSLEGEFKLERYDAATKYYYGSYQLAHSSTMNDALTIIGNFKIVIHRSQF